jgi:MFS superfamily sulfate permease-like transporter
VPADRGPQSTTQRAAGRSSFGTDGAVVIALVLLFLTQPVAKLPTACLGAVIVSAAVGLVDHAAWRSLARVGRMEVVIAMVALVGVVVFGVLEALIVSVVLSLIEVVRRSAKPHDAVLGLVPRMGRYANVSLHRTAKVTPGVVVYRLDDRLFYANSRYVSGRVQEAIDGAATPTNWLVFDAEGVVDIDASGIETVSQLARSLRAGSTTLVVARMKGRAATRVQSSGLMDEIGRDHFYPTVRMAVQACVDADAAAKP